MNIETEPEHQCPENQIWEYLQWYPSYQQLKQLSTLQNLLKQLNKQVNLTRLVHENDFWISQILDSLLPFKNELSNQSQTLKIIDVGTGCGLPGLAIAIALPKSKVILVDSISKKTAAVRNMVESLGLQNRVNVLTERIETTGHQKAFRGGFDLAVARAVAKGPVLAEYLLPLLKPSGQAILYKGTWGKTDQEELVKALSQLQGAICKVVSFQLPKGRGVRNIIYLKSTGQCPQKYPRSIGKPLKKPLNH